MLEVSVAQAREELAELLNRVHYQGLHVAITRRGKAIAAIIPMAQLLEYQKLEDRRDLQDAMQADPERDGAVPLEQVMAEIHARRRSPGQP
jgi:prevent-host-death family protein